ncbi:MAG: flagellar M-ring protein FliF, partial [Rhodospirillaceae bacterium]|nr:flagellar M-ring protein FliF [Rhodospirillaceae bacterium]
MDTLLQSLKNLGPMRLAIMGAVFIGMIAFFIYLATRLTAPQMALLYGDLQGTDSSSIVTQLSSQNIPFELRAGGAEVHVPASRVGEIRLQMAGQGIPSGGSIGYELFDKQSGMGSTNFQQNVNLVRALEGELARTIGTIDSVKSARIHLVMPKRELFQRQQSKPSASVFLKMNGANRLDNQQASAVQHLIAAAVPGLSPQSISIIDSKGELLARGYEGDPTSP